MKYGPQFTGAVVLLAVAVSAGSCVTGSQRSGAGSGEEVMETPKRGRGKNAPKKGSQKGKNNADGKKAAKPKGKKLPPDPCVAFSKIGAEPPIFLQPPGVVLSRVMKPCLTRKGEEGFEKGTPWMAMGFPCSGGSGQIDVTGNYFWPKMVSFVLGTDCPMMPAERQAVQKAVEEHVDIPEGTKLVAYNPFVVQYWEVQGLPAADTGFTVELRSQRGRRQTWKKMRQGEPLKVRLYGRENAWVARDRIFEVQVEIHTTGKHTFKLKITKVTALDDKAVADVKNRCFSLRPRRECANVF